MPVSTWRTITNNVFNISFDDLFEESEGDGKKLCAQGNHITPKLLYLKPQSVTLSVLASRFSL